MTICSDLSQPGLMSVKIFETRCDLVTSSTLYLFTGGKMVNANDQAEHWLKQELLMTCKESGCRGEKRGKRQTLDAWQDEIIAQHTTSFMATKWRDCAEVFILRQPRREHRDRKTLLLPVPWMLMGPNSRISEQKLAESTHDMVHWNPANRKIQTSP